MVSNNEQKCLQLMGITQRWTCCFRLRVLPALYPSPAVVPVEEQQKPFPPRCGFPPGIRNFSMYLCSPPCNSFSLLWSPEGVKHLLLALTQTASWSSVSPYALSWSTVLQKYGFSCSTLLAGLTWLLCLWAAKRRAPADGAGELSVPSGTNALPDVPCSWKIHCVHRKVTSMLWDLQCGFYLKNNCLICNRNASVEKIHCPLPSNPLAILSLEQSKSCRLSTQTWNCSEEHYGHLQDSDTIWNT